MYRGIIMDAKKLFNYIFKGYLDVILIFEDKKLIFSKNIDLSEYGDLKLNEIVDEKFTISTLKESCFLISFGDRSYRVKLYTHAFFDNFHDFLDYLMSDHLFYISDYEVDDRLRISLTHKLLQIKNMTMPERMYDPRVDDLLFESYHMLDIKKVLFLEYLQVTYKSESVLLGLMLDDSLFLYHDHLWKLIEEDNLDRINKKMYFAKITIFANMEANQYTERLEALIEEDFKENKLDIRAVRIENTLFLISNEEWFKLVAYFRNYDNPINRMRDEIYTEFDWRFVVSQKTEFSRTQYNTLNTLESFYMPDEYNRIRLGSEMNRYAQQKELFEAFSRKLNIEHMELHGQEIMNLKVNDVVGFEVFLRYHHPEYGLMNAIEFISIAKKKDIIIEMDMWVIMEVVNVLKAYGNKFNGVNVHINLSLKSLKDPRVIKLLMTLESGIINKIVIELSEINERLQVSTYRKLYKKGFKLAIDMVHSNMARFTDEHYKYFKIYKVKRNTEYASISYENNIDFSKTLQNFRDNETLVIVEGIESKNILEMAYRKGIRVFQGYYFSKPKPLSEKLDDWQSKALTLDLDHKTKEIVKNHYLDSESLVYVQPINEAIEIVSPNISLALRLGYDLENYKRMNFIQLIDKQLWGSFKNFIELKTNKDMSSIIIKLKDRAGKYHEVLIFKRIIEEKINLVIEFSTDEADYKLMGLSSLYTSAFENSKSSMIIVSSEFRIRKSNLIFKKNFGSILDQKNISLFNVLGHSFSEQKIRQLFKDAKPKGSSSMTINVFFSENKEIVYNWNVSAFVDDISQMVEYLCIIEDVTLDINVASKLKKISSALDQSHSIVIITDILGKIEYVNKTFKELTGYDDSVIGTSVDILDSGSHPEEYFDDMWYWINSGEIWQGEFLNKRKDGSTFWCNSIIYPLQENDGIIGFVNIQEDISNEKALEVSNQDLKNRLIEQDKIASIGMISSGLMHEINNPLSFVYGNIQFLEENFEIMDTWTQDDIEDMQEAIDDIKKGVKQIKEIAEGLKRYIFKNDEELNTVNIVEELKTVLLITKNEYKYDAHVSLLYDKNLDYIINGNASKLKQVFMNLIINATHAIKSQSEDAFGEIKIELSRINHEIIIAFSDSGCGISQQMQDKIFEPLFTTKKEGVGSGLGLSVSKNIIEDHEGRIELVSEVNKGSTFTIYLSSGELESE